MRLLPSVAVLVALSAPAGATEWISCAAAGNVASADLLVGMVNVISIAQAKLAAGGRTWATDAEGSHKIVVGQAFEDADRIVIDFTDPGVSTIMASLRLFKASEAEDDATGGVLRISGVGAWAVACSGP